MPKTRASTSKRPHIEESPQEEEENLSKTYKAKFLILSHAEGTKLTTIRFREILGWFHFIPARSHSYWRGLAGSSRVKESSPAPQTESEPEEDLPQYQPFGDVPLLTYPLQNAPRSSSDHPPIWDQILNNQISMQWQLNEMDLHQKQLARRQWKM